ncbi:MAG: hypothetical protein ACLR5H_02605 [Oscillospiraceae bacterium]
MGHCLIQKPEADALAQALRDYVARFQVAPYDEATGRGLLRHLYVRTSCTGESLVCLLVNGRSLPHEEELVAMLRAAAPKTCGVVLGKIPAGETPSWGTGTAPCGAGTI